MATAKKAAKKTVKKAVKKATKVVQTVGGKNNKRPVAAAVAKILAPDLNLARRIIAHDLVNRGGLRVGDEVRLRDEDDRVSDTPYSLHDEWDQVSGDCVIFKGIEDSGLLRVADGDDDTYVVPVEAIRWDTIEEASEHSFKLNEDYHADLRRVEDDGIVEVGCQEIEVSVIEALYKRLQEAKSGKDTSPSRELTLIPGGVYAELVAVGK